MANTSLPMDSTTSTALNLGQGGNHRNSTDLLMLEEEASNIATLTIVVWVVGGLILIIFLSLLGRIILARKKEFGPEANYRDRSNVFRIRLDMPQYLECPSSSVCSPGYDTVGLVPESSTPRHNSNQSAGSQNPNCSPAPPPYENNEQFPMPGSNHSLTPPVTLHARQTGHFVTSGQCAPPDGNQVSINGVVIKPPSYDQVVTSDERLPYVIVARDTQSTPRTQRQLFSL